MIDNLTMPPYRHDVGMMICVSLFCNDSIWETIFGLHATATFAINHPFHIDFYNQNDAILRLLHVPPFGIPSFFAKKQQPRRKSSGAVFFYARLNMRYPFVR